MRKNIFFTTSADIFVCILYRQKSVKLKRYIKVFLQLYTDFTFPYVEKIGIIYFFFGAEPTSPL